MDEESKKFPLLQSLFSKKSSATEGIMVSKVSSKQAGVAQSEGSVITDLDIEVVRAAVTTEDFDKNEIR